jgi:predicted transglutaminase-like cysteine proteinase
MGRQMLIRTAVGAALLGAVWSASIAAAFDAAPDKARFGIEYGKTLPPIGFVQFCVDNPRACTSKSASAKLAMTQSRWELLAEVNDYVNGKIKPVSDQDQYGVSERWTVPVSAGDCEDYVLLKKQMLETLGVAAGNLLITVVLDEKREGHAVLTVVTSEGDYILDNRRNEVLRWNETTYAFLKRQSRSNPLNWVALTKEGLKKKSLTTSRG